MQITFYGGGKFEIKIREGRIETGETLRVNDVSVASPGEYEVVGITLERLGNLTRIQAEGLTLAYLNKRSAPLSDQELEFLGEVDLLFLPTGSPDVLSAKDALALVGTIEPRIVIPMYFEDLVEFRKAEGLALEELATLKLSKATLPPESGKVVILKRT